MTEYIDCRRGCGACCIAPSIVEPFMGMPNGKRAGEPCVHLDQGNNYSCKIFLDPRRPKVCEAFKAEKAICGDDREQAISILNRLELITLSNI